MAAGQGRSGISNVGKAVSGLYPELARSATTRRRIVRVLGWGAFVAAITALNLALALGTGGLSLAASQSIVAFVAKDAVFAGIEALLFASMAEWRATRTTAHGVGLAARIHAGERSVVRRISAGELESQIKRLEVGR